MPNLRFFFFALLLTTAACVPKETDQPSVYAGGQEPHTANTPMPRILVNGGIVGFQQSDYEAPFWEGDNLMVDAVFVLQRLDYQVTSQNGALTASRKGNNLAGKTSIIVENTKTQALANDRTYTLPTAAVVRNGHLFAPARFLLEMAGCGRIEWDKDTHSLQSFYWEELDYGLYFYGKQNGSGDAAGHQKYIPNEPNTFFDPSKPTVIYTHGWQLDGVKNKGRETFELEHNGTLLHTQNYWIDRGWNVAIFHWIQFADDGGVPPPREAEAKIYDINNTLSQMRWKRSDGSLVANLAQTPQKSVSQLYADAYQRVFANFTGSEIRLIGNSLGGNLTMAMLYELHQRSASLMPKRVTLIDPYWSPNLSNAQVNFPNNYTTASELATVSATIQRDNYNTAIEYLRSSAAGQSGTSEGVVGAAAFSHFGTDYTWNVLSKHTVPVRQYMWSIAFAAPQELVRLSVTAPLTPTGEVAGSAATPNARIRSLMRNDKYWNHVEGRATISPDDDKFELRDGLY